MTTRRAREGNRAGGWQGNPNSIEALRRHQRLFGSPLWRLCTRCTRVAARGRATCLTHTPGYKKPDTPGRVARRTLDAMAKAGLVPLALATMELWDRLFHLAREVGPPVRLALVLSWDYRDSEPLRWAQVWRLALATVRDHAR